MMFEKGWQKMHRGLQNSQNDTKNHEEPLGLLYQLESSVCIVSSVLCINQQVSRQPKFSNHFQ